MSAHFLQSEEWEQILGARGHETMRIAGVLVARHVLPLGLHYLYAPRPEVSNEFLTGAEVIAKREQSVFLKVDPLEISSVLHGRHAISQSIQPQKTLLVDLAKSEGELLRAMHHKTRYNIRVAERAGVLVECVPYARRMEVWKEVAPLFQETARRDGFRLHPPRHYESLFSVRTDSFSNELCVARLGKELLAAALVNVYYPSGTATYIHGASGRSRKEAMAPTLLHWRVMQEMQTRGMGQYDFGGIDEARWPGITRFKKGFGGRVVEFPDTVDCIYRPAVYRIYRIARALI